MIASVWNWDRLEYDYYTVPGAGPGVGGWKPLTGLGIRKKHGSSAPSGGVGSPLEAVLPQLPSGARKVGRGVQARGAVMIRRDSLASFAGLGASALDGAPWLVPAVVGATTAFFVTRLVPEQRFPGAVVGFAFGLGVGIELSKDRNDGP